MTFSLENDIAAFIVFITPSYKLSNQVPNVCSSKMDLNPFYFVNFNVRSIYILIIKFRGKNIIYGILQAFIDIYILK